MTPKRAPFPPAVERLHAFFDRLLVAPRNASDRFSEHLAGHPVQYHRREILRTLSPYKSVGRDQVTRLQHGFKHILLEDLVRQHESFPNPAAARLSPQEKQTLRDFFRASTYFHLPPSVPENPGLYSQHYLQRKAEKLRYVAALLRVASLPHFEEVDDLMKLHRGLWEGRFSEPGWMVSASDVERAVVHGSLELVDRLWSEVLHFRKKGPYGEGEINGLVRDADAFSKAANLSIGQRQAFLENYANPKRSGDSSARKNRKRLS